MATLSSKVATALSVSSSVFTLPLHGPKVPVLKQQDNVTVCVLISWFCPIHEMAPLVRKPCKTHWYGYVLYYGLSFSFSLQFQAVEELTDSLETALLDNMQHMLSYCAWSVSVWVLVSCANDSNSIKGKSFSLKLFPEQSVLTAVSAGT